MSKIVVVVPNQLMMSQAENAVRKINTEATIIHETSNTVVEAVRLQRAQGAVVAVARGVHAHLLMAHMDIPVVEIVLSGQNLALLFSQARQMSTKQRLHIGLIGFQNMFGDVETLAKVLDLDVETFFVNASSEIGEAVATAKKNHCDVIIGGEVAMEHAARLNMTHLFLHSTQDSVEIAIHAAQRIKQALDIEKRKSAEFSSLVNYSFDAILKLDEAGTVITANYMAEKIFKKDASTLYGQHISTLFEDSTADHPIKAALTSHQNIFATTVRINKQALIANLATITVDGVNMGFILSLQEFKKIEELEEQIRKERYSRGFVATQTFDGFTTTSASMHEIIKIAKQYARYDLPVLLMGDVGVGKHALAECIHNASLRHNNPFVSVDCGGLSPTMQQTRFMGGLDEKTGVTLKGAFETAHTGTLLIEHIDKLDEFCQYQLLHVLKNSCLVRMDGRMLLPIDIRILCTTDKNLYHCLREGRFLEPLYCMLSQLELLVPSLNARAEDMPALLDFYIEKYTTLYRKYIRLSPQAREMIYAQKWNGNVLQLSLFCEKLVLLADEKMIQENFVQRHLPLSFVGGIDTRHDKVEHIPIMVQSAEEAALLMALEEFNGNRAAAAKALGISKTTLWRRMKKYGIEQSFH